MNIWKKLILKKLNRIILVDSFNNKIWEKILDKIKTNLINQKKEYSKYFLTIHLFR